MTDKTLKIRIKLHKTQDLSANEPPLLDKIKNEPSSTEQYGGKHKHLTKVILVFAGLFLLTATVFYFRLSNRDTVGKSASIDVQSAMLSDSSQQKPQSSANVSVSAFPLSAPSMNNLSSFDEPIRPIPKEVDIDDEPMPSNLQKNETQQSNTVILADESSPLSEPIDQQHIANEPSFEQADEAVSTPTSDSQTATYSPEGMPLSEPGDTEDLAKRPETLNSDVSVDPSYLLDSPNIARAQLTNGVINREPIDRIEEAVHVDGQPLKRLFYYTEFLNMQGQKAVHRWEHDGKVVAEVKFDIRGDRWRVYSSKYLSPSMTGDWKIHVIDAEGIPLKSEHFVYSSYE